MGARLMTEMTCDNCGTQQIFAATVRKTGWIRGSVSVHNEAGSERNTRYWVACKEACISAAVLKATQSEEDS